MLLPLTAAITGLILFLLSSFPHPVHQVSDDAADRLSREVERIKASDFGWADTVPARPPVFPFHRQGQ